MRLSLVIAGSLLTSGCAHVLEIVDNQQIETSHLGDKRDRSHDVRVITIDGARRLIRSSYNANQWAVCAETQADAIGSRSSSSEVDVTGRGKVGDTLVEALTTTYTRTELSDTVRQLSWQICNNRANGYLDDNDVKVAMTNMVNGTMLVLQLRANADLAAYEKAKKDLAATTAKLTAYVDCVTKADGDKAKIAACKV